MYFGYALALLDADPLPVPRLLVAVTVQVYWCPAETLTVIGLLFADADRVRPPFDDLHVVVPPLSCIRLGPVSSRRS